MAGRTAGRAMSLGQEASGETAGSSGENPRRGESGVGELAGRGRVGQSVGAESVKYSVDVTSEGEHDGSNAGVGTTVTSSAGVSR